MLWIGSAKAAPKPTKKGGEKKERKDGGGGKGNKKEVKKLRDKQCRFYQNVRRLQMIERCGLTRNYLIGRL